MNSELYIQHKFIKRLTLGVNEEVSRSISNSPDKRVLRWCRGRLSMIGAGAVETHCYQNSAKPNERRTAQKKTHCTQSVVFHSAGERTPTADAASAAGKTLSMVS